MTRFFRVHVPAASITLLISEILLVTTSFVLATYLAPIDVDPYFYLIDDGGLLKLLPVLLTILIGMHFSDLYSQIHIRSRLILLQQLCLVMGAALLGQGLISYVSAGLRIPIRIMAIGTFFSMASMFGWRILFSAVSVGLMGRERLLLVGGSPLLEDIAAHIGEHPAIGLEVSGYVADDRELGALLPGGKVLGKLADLRDVVQALRPSRIVVGLAERRQTMPMAELLDLRFAGHVIEEASSTYENVCGRVSLRDLRPSQLIYSGELGPHMQSIIVQTLFNRILSAGVLIVTFPIILLTALAVKLTSPGPILYRQVRTGRDGVPFTVYKFRSMRVDAEAQTGAVWASKDDPRITKVGRIIRKLRFDELPQLFNSLKGDMSLVGPRPERPEFVKDLSREIPYYGLRHSVRPGITGWAQINYKYGDTLADTMAKLEYDLYYIKNMSFRLDTYIILQTVKAMLLSRGAQ
jgi:sugar transferase (PEP-CTERM system associated)